MTCKVQENERMDRDNSLAKTKEINPVEKAHKHTVIVTVTEKLNKSRSIRAENLL